MLIRSVENNSETTMIVGGGEWWDSLIKMSVFAGIPFVFDGRCLVGVINQLSIKIIKVRPKNVPELLTEDGCSAEYGITGDDCYKEWQLSQSDKSQPALLEQKLTQPFDVLPLAPPPPSVSLFTTPNSKAKNRKELIAESGIIVTTFPNITRLFLGEKNRIVSVGGGSEGYWHGNKKNTAVVDAKVSGKTARENQLAEIEKLITVVRLIGLLPASATFTAIQRVNDLREALVAIDAQKVRDEYTWMSSGSYRNGISRKV